MEFEMKNRSKSAALGMAMVLAVLAFPVSGADETGGTALLLVDIQNFYFPGGRSELVDPEAASLNARKLLQEFRERKLLVVHVRHNAEQGADIHMNVRPLEGEKIVSKNHINCFKDTDLLEYLRKNEIKKLVICGMMTQMCVEAAVRAAHDFDFETILIQDACATRALRYGDREVSAADVHCSTLSSLDRYYASVLDTETFLKDF
jgi:nicotinamidase-related amidase